MLQKKKWTDFALIIFPFLLVSIGMASGYALKGSFPWGELLFPVSFSLFLILGITSLIKFWTMKTRQKELENKMTSTLEYVDALWENQSALIQDEKLSALNSLVERIASEIKNPLGISITSASYLEEIIHKDKFDQEFKDNAQASLDLLKESLVKSRKLINFFKELAEGQNNEQTREVNLLDFLQGTVVEMCPKDIREGKVIDIQCPSDISINTYILSLAIILRNILLNALEFAYPQDAPGKIEIQTNLEDRDLVIVVKDHGRGIPMINQKHVFDPFFTTNRSGGHNGLGLSIAINLLTRQLGGKIFLDSLPGKGTRVTLRVPEVVTC